MSILSGIIDVARIKRTELMGDAKDVIAAFFETPEQDADEGVSESESEPVNWWQQYGFVSRPPAGAESLFVRLGKQAFAIASRTLAAAGIFGQLNEGDVAIFSLGKNVLRMNADGSVMLLKLTKSDKHLVITVTKDDEIKVLVPDGPHFEMSKKQTVLHAGNARLTLASNVAVQVVAPQMLNEVGINKLHMGAVRPMVAPNAAPNLMI